MVYASMTYPFMNPFLKGFHLSADMYRPNRDSEGWKVPEWKQAYDSADTPERVKPISRFAQDLLALEELTRAETPPRRRVRPRGCAVAHFSFGDASGAGFGYASWQPNQTGVQYTFGLWCQDVSEASSSNYRELLNIVLKLEAMEEQGELDEGVEVFIFTDNMHAESVFHRGDARSEAIFDLTLRLHRIMMSGKAFIHVVWVAGERMIAQGVDGLSRGDLTNGVMGGQSMLDFVPLHLSARQRQPGRIESFVSFLTERDKVKPVFLEAEDWFVVPFTQDGTFVWCPPPAAADVAVELMAEAIHLRPWNTHIFICPVLMTGKWRKLAGKASDLSITLPFDDEFWPADCEYERLSLAISFPLLNRAPWRVKRTDFCLRQQDQMHRLQRCLFAQARNHLRKFWLFARSL